MLWPLLIIIFLLSDGYTGLDGLRTGIFQTLAVTTTAGLMTDDFDRYPDAIRLMLFFCMFVGGCAGSTSGGLKVSRIGILWVTIVNEIKHIIRPQAVMSVRIGNRAISDEVLRGIFSFLGIYFLIFAVCSLLLSSLGLDFVSAMSSVVASLSGIGPGLASVGPSMNYEMVPAIGKLILCFCMIAGRLEIMVVMAMVSPLTWRK